MSRALTLLLCGTNTAHDPGYVVDRRGPKSEWVVLCFRTPFIFRANDTLEVGQPGDCVVHDARAWEWHTAPPGASEGFRNDWLHLRPEHMEVLTRQYGVPLNTRIPTGYPSFLADHLHTIMLEERRREAHWVDRISLELEMILLRLGRAHLTHQMGQRLSATERAHLSKFTGIRSAMLDRYPEAWNVHDLASAAHMSTARFSVLYARFFNVSPIEELIQQRIKQACAMLAYSRDSLEVIAVACGFTDAPHFSRMFKQRLGCTPGTYRRLGAPSMPMAPGGTHEASPASNSAPDR